MGDKMRLLPFTELLERIFEEYRNQKSIFDIGEESWYRKGDGRTLEVFGETCETVLGPAAGPHTQLASNILSSYLTGSRFIELKTVQILDALEIEKPCIDAHDEGYNTEWSTELALDEAWSEYSKAWILLHLIEELFELKSSDAERSFIFNMSVGYDLKGIQTGPMQQYLRRMKDSSGEPRFSEWIEIVRSRVPAMLTGTGLEKRGAALAEFTVSPHICRSVTLSTMHGCPPDEIEAICSYMLVEQGLDTYVKLNPTLLGYDTVKEILTGLGYDYVSLNREGFEHDLQYDQALEILTRLRAVAREKRRRFGVKLTNTLASINNRDELPGGEMYLSGRALFPLSITVAARLSEEFGGDLPISFSGGITIHNVEAVFRTGIRPITLATDLLKPGGYLRQVQMARAVEGIEEWEAQKIDVMALAALAESSYSDETLHKDFRGTDEVASPGALPTFDCYEAPCITACAIHQHIPEYIRLVGRSAMAKPWSASTSVTPCPRLPAISAIISVSSSVHASTTRVVSIFGRSKSSRSCTGWMSIESGGGARLSISPVRSRLSVRARRAFRRPISWPGRVSKSPFSSGKPTPPAWCATLYPISGSAARRLKAMWPLSATTA